MVETATTLNRNRLARTQKVQTKRRSRRDTDKIIGTRDVATIIGINGVMILLKEFTATKEDDDDEQQKNKHNRSLVTVLYQCIWSYAVFVYPFSYKYYLLHPVAVFVFVFVAVRSPTFCCFFFFFFFDSLIFLCL